VCRAAPFFYSVPKNLEVAGHAVPLIREGFFMNLHKGMKVKVGDKYAEKHNYQPIIGREMILHGDPYYSDGTYANHVMLTTGWIIRVEDAIPANITNNRQAAVLLEEGD
jgi:hypothetical protein